MANDVFYRGEGDENSFHNSEIRRLKDVENAASEDFSDSEAEGGDYNQALDNQRANERRPVLINGREDYSLEGDMGGGFWRGIGRGGAKKRSEKKGFLGKMKAFGPVGLIIFALFGAGGIAFMSVSMGPFALVSNALDQFNMMRTSMNRRSTYFMRFQMDESLNTSLTNRRFGIFSSEKFKISKSMQKNLQKNNIDYMEDSNTKVRYLVYTDPDTGEVTPVVANDADLGKLNGVEIENSEGVRATKSVVKMDDFLEADDGFFTAHQNATKTVKGHIVGWFEDLTQSFHNRIKNSRNRFAGTADDADEETVKQKAKATGLDEGVGESSGTSYTRDDDSDENGIRTTETAETDPNDPTKTITKTETVDTKEAITGSESLSGSSSPEQVESALVARTNKISALMSKAGQAESIACGVANALSAMNLVLTGIQVAKTLNFVTGMLEAVQRTQIGDSGSEMMVYFNAFSEPKETEVWEGSGTNIEKQVISTASTMSTPAYNATFGGPNPDPNDPGVRRFNRDYAVGASLEAAINGGGGGTLRSAIASLVGNAVQTAVNVSSSTLVYQGCLYAELGLNTVSIAIDVISLFVTGGIGNLVKTFVGKIIEAGKMAAISLAVSLIVSWMVPRVAQWLATDLIGDIGGENSANAMRSGFNIYMGKAMEANSGAVGDETAILAMYDQMQAVLADDARYDRTTLSPLDPTSKYTFVGGIVHSLLPVGNLLAGNSLLKAAGQTLTTVGKSVLNLVPATSAGSKYSSAWRDADLNTDCPNLSALGLVGDAYCNPYYTSDFSTINMNPYEVVERAGLENFEGDASSTDENPAIKKDSDLGKYIVACTLRDAQYGLKDAAVQSFIENPTGNSTLNAIIDSGTGMIPIVGDLYDAAKAASEAINLPWNTGKNCIQNETINDNWKKFKYFQRYIEDQTLMEAAGIIDKSQVAAFVEDYYRENPLDDSYEGVIARYTGLTTEEVGEVIALAEYINFIGEYRPAELYPVPAEDKIVEISLSNTGASVEKITLGTVDTGEAKIVFKKERAAIENAEPQAFERTKYVAFSDLRYAPTIG